jgi:hypothetical protein
VVKEVTTDKQGLTPDLPFSLADDMLNQFCVEVFDFRISKRPVSCPVAHLERNALFTGFNAGALNASKMEISPMRSSSSSSNRPTAIR